MDVRQRSRSDLARGIYWISAWELLNQTRSHTVVCEMNRWMTVSLSKPKMVDITGLRWNVLNFAGCVSPLDARYASP